MKNKPERPRRSVRRMDEYVIYYACKDTCVNFANVKSVTWELFAHSDFKLALWRNQDRAEALLRVLIAALRAEIDALIARYAWVWTRSWVLFFVWALRDTSGRYMVDCTRAIFSQTVRTAAAYFAISLLRPSGEKKQTFSLVSLQLTVQLPCRNVFSSFILPLRACQKRSFDDVSTVGAGAERGVKSRQTNRSPQSLRSTKIRAWLP